MEDADSIHSMESSVESEPDQDDLNIVMTKESKHKPGIIYLSRVPTGYNVSQTTQFFSEFGRYLTYQENNGRLIYIPILLAMFGTKLKSTQHFN